MHCGTETHPCSSRRNQSHLEGTLQISACARPPQTCVLESGWNPREMEAFAELILFLCNSSCLLMNSAHQTRQMVLEQDHLGSHPWKLFEYGRALSKKDLAGDQIYCLSITVCHASRRSCVSSQDADWRAPSVVRTRFSANLCCIA